MTAEHSRIQIRDCQLKDIQREETPGNDTLYTLARRRISTKGGGRRRRATAA